MHPFDPPGDDLPDTIATPPGVPVDFDHAGPDRIGPYRILGVLGQGGMGLVYEAEQLEPLHRLVALKIIKLGMDTKEVLSRFDTERQALAVMDHPTIAKALDAGSTDAGRPYFVMELVRGVPLTEYCDKHQLSTRQRLELFISVCQGVAALETACHLLDESGHRGSMRWVAVATAAALGSGPRVASGHDLDGQVLPTLEVPMPHSTTQTRVHVGLFVRLEAKPGQERAVAEFLESALPLVEQEPATTTWYAIKLGPSSFGIFDTFSDDQGRDAHLAGKVAAALMQQAPHLLATAPTIEKTEILAAKLPPG